MNNQAVPAGYSMVRSEKRTIVFKTAAGDSLRRLMSSGFPELAASEKAVRVTGGRAGPVHLPLDPGSPERVLIRPYAHGGLLGFVRGRTFSAPDRAFDELRASDRAASLGLPVVPLVGITVERIRHRRWTMEAWSGWISGARPLPLALADSADAADRRKVMSAVAVAVRRCHDAGLLHFDLNSRNVLLDRSGVEGDPQARLIDLDRARFRDLVDTHVRMSQIERLLRSLAKEGVFPRLLGVSEFRDFAAGYFGEAVDAAGLDRFVSRCRSAIFRHSLLWPLTGRGRPPETPA